MHQHMILDINECIEKTHINNKITAIIPTSQNLLVNILTLLTNSKNILEHIIVCLHGENQNKNQHFLEELRELTYHNNPMPLTIIRIYNKSNNHKAILSAINWTHTNYYMILSNLITQNWEELTKQHFFKDDVAIAYSTNALLIKKGLIMKYCHNSNYTNLTKHEFNIIFLNLNSKEINISNDYVNLYEKYK